jgi:hypothetical protein
MEIMKIVIEVRSYLGGYGERGLSSFVNKVKKILKQADITGRVVLDNAWMERASGRGSYNRCIDIEVNGLGFTIKQHTHDSQAWDAWENPSNKEKRDLFLGVLDSEIEKLKEEL